MKSNGPPEVLKSAHQLAKLLKEHRDALDQETWAQGENFLSITNDKSFDKTILGLLEKKIKIIQEAIEDLADRGKLLAEAQLGILMDGQKIETFLCQYGETPLGKVIFKIAIKDVDSFKAWRQGQGQKTSENDVNSGIYRLSALWAELL